MEAIVLDRKIKNLPFETLGNVHFSPVNGHDVAPEGYMTVEEFRAEAKQSLTKILNEHGIC